MAIDKQGNGDGVPEKLRPARMQIETTVLMSRHGESHPTELVDISATGALLRRPLGWSGEPGQSWVLDMIFGHNLHIHLEATVARISDHHIGFSYSRIPEDKQVPLWNLLGGYADIRVLEGQLTRTSRVPSTLTHDVNARMIHAGVLFACQEVRRRVSFRRAIRAAGSCPRCS